ncbi:hypothetical protein V8C44DRAFT_333131 [Trichoderma aethiopicum]
MKRGSAAAMPVRLAATSWVGFLLLQSRGLDRQTSRQNATVRSTRCLEPEPKGAPFRFPHRRRHDGASNPILPAA